MRHLFCFGLGFSGNALGRSLLHEGWRVSGTTRNSNKLKIFEQRGFDVYFYPGEECLIEDQLLSATHLMITIPPQMLGDLVFKEYRELITHNQNLCWVGYLSSTGVYGNHGGKWVNEASFLLPSSERNYSRIKAENQWLELHRKEQLNVHIFRAAGIYGPGRNILETVKLGKARRIEKKGQVNGRIHVDDLVEVIKASMGKPNPGSIYNVCDDEPVPSQEVVEFACQLLKVEPPPVIPFNKAELSEAARSFYLDNKKVSNEKIKTELDIKLKYPDYRKGLKKIFLNMEARS